GAKTCFFHLPPINPSECRKANHYTECQADGAKTVAPEKPGAEAFEAMVHQEQLVRGLVFCGQIAGTRKGIFQFPPQVRIYIDYFWFVSKNPDGFEQLSRFQKKPPVKSVLIKHNAGGGATVG